MWFGRHRETGGITETEAKGGEDGYMDEAQSLTELEVNPWSGLT